MNNETKINYRELLFKYIPKEQFDPKFLAFVKRIRHLLRKEDRDVILGITGFEGIGKSNLGILLTMLIDDDFDFDNNVSYVPSSKEIVLEFEKINQFGCYMIDEAIRGLYKMNFQNSLQQAVIKMYATSRYQNKCSILIIPRFLDFTEHFRNHRIRTWINVCDRGEAIVYIKDPDQSVLDCWHLKDARKKKKRLLSKRISSISVDERMREERKLTTYLTDFKFPKLPQELKDIYELKRREANIKARVIDGDEDDIERDTKALLKAKTTIVSFVDLIEHRLKVSRKELAEISAYNYDTLLLILNDERYKLKPNAKPQTDNLDIP